MLLMKGFFAYSREQRIRSTEDGETFDRSTKGQSSESTSVDSLAPGPATSESQDNKIGKVSAT